jgi:signal transduction histidine kinase
VAEAARSPEPTPPDPPNPAEGTADRGPIPGPGSLSRGRESTPELKLVAMREHSLLSLFELSRELSVMLDARGIADLVLFNLMGHLGTAQAVMWLEAPGQGTGLDVVRCHGVRPEIATVLGTALSSLLHSDRPRLRAPTRISDARTMIEPAAADLAHHSGVALLAPLLAGSRIRGFVGLGRRAAGADFTDFDLDVLNASLGMVAVAIENRRLYASLEQHNQDLARANTELRELDRIKSEFLQTVNHELRTPLAIIIGCVDCLLQEADPDPARQRFVTGVMEQATKLRDMVQTLLDFASTLDGSMDLDVMELDPRSLAVEYYESRHPHVVESHPEFTLSVEPGRGVFHSDRMRIFQVLDALLDNAVKFTPRETRIELRLHETERDGRRVIALRIADNGPGISSAHLAELFKPFRQADNSATRKVGGLGMGLATARRVAERLGGQLLVDSAAGRGSTFSLILPVA